MDETKKPMTTPSQLGGHNVELVDHYWGSINHVSELIRASEIKAGLILSFYGILLNIIFLNLGKLFVPQHPELLVVILLGILGSCVLSSIFYAVRCFMPRIEAKFDTNVFFFGDVITKFGGVKDFSRTFYEISIDEHQLFDQLGQQIFVLSKISALKFKYVNRSIRLLGLSLLLLFVVLGVFVGYQL